VTEADLGPSADEKRAALDDVLRSRIFERSAQLQSFLRYVCEKEIAGRAGELSEHLIGVEALGRPAGYSPAEDSVVRRRAIDLRDKLQEVYESELVGAAVRIELPKGRYVPRFVRASSSAAAPVAGGVSLEPRASVGTGRRRAAMAAAFAGGVVIGAVGVWLRLSPGPPPPARPARGTSYEAEQQESVLSGLVVRDRCEACSGGARVRNVGRTRANYVAFPEVMAASEGNYLLTIHYLLDGERTLFVRVNDGPPQELPLKGDTWLRPANVTVTVPLRAGRNEIRLYNERAVAPDVDCIEIW